MAEMVKIVTRCMRMRVDLSRWTKDTVCPVFWRETTKLVNASPSSPLPEDESSFSSGNSSTGNSPPIDAKERESARMKSLGTRSTFRLLNDLRSSRHCDRLTSLVHPSGDKWLLVYVYSRIRFSTEENSVLNELIICAADATCQSRGTPLTSIDNKPIVPTTSGYSNIQKHRPNVRVARLNLRFSIALRICRRCGRGKESWRKNSIRSASRGNKRVETN